LAIKELQFQSRLSTIYSGGQKRAGGGGVEAQPHSLGARWPAAEELHGDRAVERLIVTIV
jgi:hypothetical protein